MLANYFFYLISILIIVFALAVITCRNSVHAVLCLVMTFLFSALIFLFAGAEFLAMSLVIVYVGAVAVLFLFIVMMLDIRIEKIKSIISRNSTLTALIAALLICELAIIANYSISEEITVSAAQNQPIEPKITNTHQIGQILYTDYFIPFQLAGLILFVAMIGSIMLTLRQRPGVKRQDMSKQVERTGSIILTNPKSGHGIKSSKMED